MCSAFWQLCGIRNRAADVCLGSIAAVRLTGREGSHPAFNGQPTHADLLKLMAIEVISTFSFAASPFSVAGSNGWVLRTSPTTPAPH